MIGLSADFPAAGALLPFMESTSAHFWCRECEQDSEACDEPFVAFAFAGLPQAIALTQPERQPLISTFTLIQPRPARTRTYPQGTS